MNSPLHDDDPRQVAGHSVVGRLGEGGSGTVYEALAPDGSRVALKVLHRELAESAELRRRLSREAQALQRVRGDRVARVLSVDAAGDTPHIVMELVEGETLAAIVEREPLRGPMLTGLAEGLIEALEDIHAAGIVHRDLKPSNIIFGSGGVKVVDFGVSAFEELAASTRTGVLMGTPAWLSPEQARGEAVGPAADVHNVGMVLALAATGVHPYGQGRPDAMLFRIVHQEPVLDGVPSALLPAVRACLAKDPRERPTLADLRAMLGGGTSGRGARPDSTRLASETRIGPVAGRRRPRRRPLVLAAVGLLTALGAGAWFALTELDARGPLLVAYVDATSENPQLSEAVLEVTSPGLSPVVIRVQPDAPQQRVERTGEWRLGSPLTVRYRPSSGASDGYLETLDLRTLGMDVLSGRRTVSVLLTITDDGSSIDVVPARGLRISASQVGDIELARVDEAEEQRRAEEAERERQAEEARREAEREREIRAERERQERELEAARQQRIAEARAFRSSCTTTTRALYDAQYGMLFFMESSYRSAKEALLAGRSMNAWEYQLSIRTLDGIMVDNHNAANASLAGAARGPRIDPATRRVFNASSTLIDSWRTLSWALNTPAPGSGSGGRYSDIYPREHAAVDSAERELSSAVGALRDALNQDAAADCARQYPDP